MHPFENLGPALRWLRWRRHRTQGDVAQSAGITRAMLSAYETGRQRPSVDTLGHLLLALSNDLSDLHQALALHQGRLSPGEVAEKAEAEPEAPPS